MGVDINLQLGDGKDIKFKLNISGAAPETITEIRLTIDIGNPKISLLSKLTLGEVIFSTKNLEKLIPVGTYQYWLEVIIVNQFFVPITGKITLKEPIRIEASPQISIPNLSAELVMKSLDKYEPDELRPMPVSSKFEDKKELTKAKKHIKTINRYIILKKGKMKKQKMLFD